MTNANVFTSLAAWLEARELVPAGAGSMVVFFGALIAIALFMVWMNMVDLAMVAHSNNPTRDNRAELIVAILAPVSVPALAVMVLVKWVTLRRSAPAAA